jgi:hypothetical protein
VLVFLTTAAFVALPSGGVPKVLILGPSVGPVPSFEEKAVRSLHPTWRVDIVTEAKWKSMKAADFASYRALILGDPYCNSINGQ